MVPPYRTHAMPCHAHRAKASVYINMNPAAFAVAQLPDFVSSSLPRIPKFGCSVSSVAHLVDTSAARLHFITCTPTPDIDLALDILLKTGLYTPLLISKGWPLQKQ
jgi:hypothetical protein